MIIDYKYHVTSLVAVFMALGIGIVIGSLLVGESFVTGVIGEQENLVQRIEEEYLSIKNEARLQKTEMEKLAQENAYYRQYADATLSYLIKGCLEGKRIVLVEDGVQTPEVIIENLRLSGAEIIYADRFPEEEGLTASGAAQGPTVLIRVSENYPEQTTSAPDTPSAALQELLEAGTPIYNLVLGENEKKFLKTQGLGRVYYIPLLDSIPEQVALILDIAESGLEP
ncbi:MAG: copper transporter [Clostridia bacterium]|jgi:hypothetical protein|nr:copper transporter [Clostridia bacterium]